MSTVERFGLLKDPRNKSGLSVGMTAHKPVDTRLVGVGYMVGFNCAACHVGAMRYRGAEVRVVGAPNLFDIKAFYASLYRSALGTLKSPSKMLAFVREIYRYKEPGENAKATGVEFLAPARRADGGALVDDENKALFLPEGTHRDVQKAWDELPDLDVLEKQGEIEKEFAVRIRQIQAGASAHPAATPETLLKLRRPDADVDTSSLTFAAEGPKTNAARDNLLGPKLGPAASSRDPTSDGPLSKQPKMARATVLAGLLSDFQRAVELLAARIEVIGLVARLDDETTVAGPGRVDAFGTARNLIFGKATAQPTRSPVSYPHLFTFAETTWLHWDGNTNSAMERNMGQAIGLGAVVNRTTFESTLLPRDIHTLERLAAKIKPPAWPADVFGPIDAAKATAGKAIFDQKCATCHGANVNPEDVTSLAAIGTDSRRAKSFAEPIGNREQSAALAAFLGNVKTKAYDDAKIPQVERDAIEGPRRPSVWRTTRGYPQRRLVSVWATAPYLHNGSVASLVELLKPAAQRLEKFKVGSREYDPKTVGYVVDVGPHEFDTKLPGNDKTGHTGAEYGTELAPSEKESLLEYLKQL